VGMLMVVFFSIIILYELQSFFKIISFLAFIVSGLLYYLFRKRHLRAIGVRIEDLTKKGDQWDV
jgi:hypothetical protein